MPLSYITTLIDDFVAALKELPEFADVSIETAWVPDVQRKQLTDIKVLVSPLARRTTLQSRHCKTTSVDLSVAILKPLFSKAYAPLTPIETIEREDVDAVQLLGDALANLVGTRTPGKLVSAVEQQVVLGNDQWREHRVAASFWRITLDE